jgi:type IX secretion system PorP/SprF family membrane protein
MRIGWVDMAIVNRYNNKFVQKCNLLYAFISLFISNGLFAQDIHFTQFFTNPLILNPAQTGNFNGNYRVGINFKAQWPWAITGTPYNYHTESPYVDFSFGEKKIKTGWMGIGLVFLNDEAGDGMLTYRRFSLSYAYHQAFDKEHRYVLSVGAVASYVIRSVDFSKFYFNDQWVEEMGFNTNVPSNEPFARESFGMFDLGAGLNFDGQVHDKVKLELGFSMLHINEPKGGFYNDNARMGFRYQPTAGIQYTVNDQWSIRLDGYYGYEKTANETVFGAMAEYGFSKFNSSSSDHSLYFGTYYRVGDAIAPLMGYRFKQMRVLLSYDVTISPLLPAAKANGGPEVSFVYVGSWTREFNGKKVYCPKF